MSQLKLIENAERVVEEALHELKCSQPALIVDKKNRIVLSDKVRVDTTNYYIIKTRIPYVYVLRVYVTKTWRWHWTANLLFAFALLRVNFI